MAVKDYVSLQRLTDYIQNDFRINYQYTENNLLKTK